MITWTDEGAVEHPTVLQIRVQRAYPGRVRAGAPVPTRSMSHPEIVSNLEFFTREMDTPRSRPCTGLVLSGVGVARRADLDPIMDAAHEWGVDRVTLHAGVEDLETLDIPRFAGRVDLLVLPIQPGAGGALAAGAAAIRACQEAGIAVASNTVLSRNALPDIMPAARAIAAACPSRATLTFPFPIAGNTSAHVPNPQAAISALQRALPVLEQGGVEVGIKGLPACYLGPLSRYLWRSANRWYVDADHQREQALLFFPSVVSFYKDEACRFCAMDARCDGFFATYLRRPSFPPLEPITE